MTRLGRLRNLLERRKCRLLTFLQAAVTLVSVACALRLVGYTRTQRVLQDSCRYRRPVSDITQSKRAVGDALNAVHIAMRLARGWITCLPRALTLHWLLARRGVDSQICLGVCLGRGGLAAHAWVERDGVPLGESASLGFTFQPLQRTDGRSSATEACGTGALGHHHRTSSALMHRRNLSHRVERQCKPKPEVGCRCQAIPSYRSTAVKRDPTRSHG